MVRGSTPRATLTRLSARAMTAVATATTPAAARSTSPESAGASVAIARRAARITSYNVCYTKLLRVSFISRLSIRERFPDGWALALPRGTRAELVQVSQISTGVDIQLILPESGPAGSVITSYSIHYTKLYDDPA